MVRLLVEARADVQDIDLAGDTALTAAGFSNGGRSFFVAGFLLTKSESLFRLFVPSHDFVSRFCLLIP